MNKLITPILTPCGGLITRTKVTLQRRVRSAEWHEREGMSKEEKLNTLKSEQEIVRRQLRLLKDRLKEKNTVTSFRGILVEKSLSNRVENLQKDLESEIKAHSENKPWWGYKRARPGHSKYSSWNYDLPRRTCYRPEKHKYMKSSCPICRDHWYPMYTDVEKIKQYVDPATNRVLPTKTTGVCQYKHNVLVEAVTRAQSMGYLTPALTKRNFNWSSSDVYGRDRTEIYGHREVYHKSYRHLPGNIHYQPDNEHWGHVPVTNTSVKHDIIQYE